VVAFWNSATVEQLDTEVGVDSRAVTGIVAARPLADIFALAAVSYVGATALTKLRDYVASHPQNTGDVDPATIVPHTIPEIQNPAIAP